ncbi:MAG: polysaccharide biosynthesis protein, partial [Thermodesulfovibrionales bacterium]
IKIYQLLKEQIIKHRFIIVSVILLIQASLANYLSFVIRFEPLPSSYYLNKFLSYLPLLLFIRLALFIKAGLYKSLWRYASISDLLKIINTSILGSIAFFVIVRYMIGDSEYPRSIYALDLLLIIVTSGGSRLLVRLIRETICLKPSRKKMLIIGSGSSGEMIVREMRNNKECLYKPIGIIDDDVQKKGLTIHGVPIMGTTDMLPEILEKEKPDEILISPGDIKKPIRNIYDICKPFNIPLKKLPNINEILENNVYVGARLGQHLVNANLVTEAQVREALLLQKREGGRLGAKLVKLGYITEEELNAFLNKQLGISHMKPISLEDLLQREPVNTDITAVREFIENKSVVVTGAGGSIGSELSRQIIRYRPANLLLFDRSENNLYEIDFELRSQKHESSITTIIGDIQDLSYLEHIFSKYKPQIVFHAAAYKHVPLMEYNPIEAVKNNILGTKNLIDVSSKYNVESFVLISTDKAVNPTSIMGATKRIAEFLTVNMNSSCKTRFTTVRFGNVLGSSGSVLQVFKDQLTKGGPLTITHPEIKRFFMLTDEAVHLVLIASASGKGGEIFVLDMGEPIKITDFAENFIRLSGFIPYKDVKIVFTGLRPGEKLYEELFDKTERVLPSFHKKIMIAVPEENLMPIISRYLPDLERVVLNHSVDEVIPLMHKMIPSFRNNGVRSTKVI